MAQLEFPRIIIDYDPNVGDIVDIVRAKKTWHITFSHLENKLVAIVAQIDTGNITEVDVTDIANEPTIVQLTIARVLWTVVYADYTDDMKAAFVAGPKRANLTQKTFDMTIIQPVKDSSGNVINPCWSCVLSENYKVVATITRHMDNPDEFRIMLPDVSIPLIIKSGSPYIPSYLVGESDLAIDLTISPTVEALDGQA